MSGPRSFSELANKPKTGAGTAERIAFWKAAADHTPLLAVDCDGQRFLVSTSDTTVGESLFRRKQRSEIFVLAKALTLLERSGLLHGSTFIDVGANIGTTTIPALRHFAEAVAIEPAPENIDLLRANLALNRLDDRVRVIEAAASNRAGTVILRTTPTKTGSHTVIEQLPAHKSVSHITVAATTLDELAGDAFDPDEVGLLWLDVQRHEGEVLDGARALVASGVPVVAEFNRDRVAPVFWDVANDAYTHVANLDTDTQDSVGDAPSTLPHGTMNLLLFRARS